MVAFLSIEYESFLLEYANQLSVMHRADFWHSYELGSNRQAVNRYHIGVTPRLLLSYKTSFFEDIGERTLFVGREKKTSYSIFKVFFCLFSRLATGGYSQFRIEGDVLAPLPKDLRCECKFGESHICNHTATFKRRPLISISHLTKNPCRTMPARAWGCQPVIIGDELSNDTARIQAGSLTSLLVRATNRQCQLRQYLCPFRSELLAVYLRR